MLSSACNGSLYSPSHGPRLTATNFLAFGDSITFGASDACPANATALTLNQLMFTLPAMGPDYSYPTVLQNLLRAEYPTQTASVDNWGVGGELLAEGAARLPGALMQVNPQVTLIVEGANDANQGVPPAQMGTSLATMIRSARAKGNEVFVGNLLPQRPRGVNGSCRGFGAANVDAANEQFRTTVRAEGAVLVDIWDAFGGVPDPYIGRDGLHPTADGYTVIAKTFLAAISARLED